MSLKITDKLIESSVTQHKAEDWGTGWYVTWIDGPPVDRNAAITAMTIAELVESGAAEGSKDWPIVRDFARELGMTAQEAAAKILGRR